MTRFLLDTNVPSELTKPRSDERVERWLEQAKDEQLYLSVISLGEIFKGLAVLPQGKRRTDIETWIEGTLRSWFAGRILPVTESIAERWGTLSGARQLSGTLLTVADGLIAATALEHGLMLVTRNVRDFAGLGIPILNPWEEQ